MSIICDLFGHRLPLSGWWGDALYGKVAPRGVDNIGRAHMIIHHICPRCGEQYAAARFHATNPQVIEALGDRAPSQTETITADKKMIARQVRRAEAEKARADTMEAVLAVMREQMKIAIFHLEHQARWIGEQKAGYSFEGLGEDMPSIRAALTACTGIAAPALARPESEWHEDMGDVVWWALGEDGKWYGEPAYIGSPLDLGFAVHITVDGKEMTCDVGGWPGYHTHWTPHPPRPELPAVPSIEEQSDGTF